MSTLSIVLIGVFAFISGIDSICDRFQLHQPIIACTFVGIATGNLEQGVILGGTLQLIALGWMNIGAATAPDAAIMGYVAAVLVCGPAALSVSQGIAIAIPLAMAGLILTVIVRTISTFYMHVADGLAKKGNTAGCYFVHYTNMCLHGLRVAIMAVLACFLPAQTINDMLKSIPDVVQTGLSVAGGCIVVVGYAMIMNMMVTKELWPFFFLGFALSALTELNLVAMGIIGVVLAMIYVSITRGRDMSQGLFSMADNGTPQMDASDTDELDQILNDY